MGVILDYFYNGNVKFRNKLETMVLLLTMIKLRATPMVLHFLFGKIWSLPTLKSMWGGEKKVISNGLAKLTCQNLKKKPGGAGGKSARGSSA
jgi:hypothetical protein